MFVSFGFFYLFISRIETQFVTIYDQKISAEQQKNQLALDAKDAALRINQALNNVNTSVLIADNQSKIIYANQSAQQLFEASETAIRIKVPDFQAKDLLSQSIEKLLNPCFA